MFSWICLMNRLLLSWIMSYRAQICFRSLQETKMARENNAPELKLRCLISEPVLTWRDLCLLSHFMLWKYRLKDSQKSRNSNFLSHIVSLLGIRVFSTLQSLAIRCLFLPLFNVHLLQWHQTTIQHQSLFLSVFVADHARVLISVLFKAGAVVLARRRAVDVIAALMVREVARMSCSCWGKAWWDWGKSEIAWLQMLSTCMLISLWVTLAGLFWFYLGLLLIPVSFWTIILKYLQNELSSFPPWPDVFLW